jgi:predicted nucleic acid-binding protein
MFLLDTNVVSELRKTVSGRTDPNVARWCAAVPPDEMFLSFVVREGLEIGILRLETRDPRGGQVMRQWLEQHVLPTFAGHILPIDDAVARQSARLQVPTTRPTKDGYIAATALVHGLMVVTRNVSDFQALGVGIVNPWAAGGSRT